MKNIGSFFPGLCHTPIVCFAAVTLLALIALAWSTPVFSGEIHEAAAVGNLAKARALLKCNPDLVFSKDKNGATPLHLAASEGHIDVVKLLLASQAEVNARGMGMTAVHLAAREGHKDVVELLLANKADVNAKDDIGKTPLHEAAYRGPQGRGGTTPGQQG